MESLSAIELAASQVGTHGIVGTWNLLRRRFGLDWQGDDEPAPTRHQTLRASLDWSYRSLKADEQLALRRLSLLTEAFTSRPRRSSPLLNMLDALVEKSLLSVLTADDGSVRYRVRRPLALMRVGDSEWGSVVAAVDGVSFPPSARASTCIDRAS